MDKGKRAGPRSVPAGGQKDVRAGNSVSGDNAGTDAQEMELPPELAQVAELYRALPVPRPSAADTARVLSRLLAEAPATSAPAGGRRRVPAALRVARWRVRLLGAQFWVASVGLLLLGAAWSESAHATSGAAPLILMAPLTAVLGLAHAMRTSSRGLRAVEASCPIGFAEVAAGLGLAIVAFDCALGVMATAVLALAHWAPFGLLLAAWIGPLFLLAGISLPVALRWGAAPAALVGGGPWLLLAALARMRPVGVFAMPTGGLSLLVHLLAAAAGLLLLVHALLGHAPAAVRAHGAGSA